jgi:hypothetical protein
VDKIFIYYLLWEDYSANRFDMKRIPEWYDIHHYNWRPVVGPFALRERLNP